MALLAAPLFAAETPEPTTLLIAVTLPAGAEEELAEESLRTAESVLARSGAPIAIVLCAKADKRPCRSRYPDPRIWVRLKNESELDQSLGRGSVFGRAYLNEQGTGGTMADVFLNRVRSHALEMGVREAALLGHAIAHEVGHLLLGRNSHSVSGLMAAKWDGAELTMAAHGRLVFLRSEADEVRRRTALRLRPAESAIALSAVRRD
ncbi:MAG: hypothetical protein H6509_15625 [Bryobacterales bacterium]|nr:hypothetical protein [Acidobacteriota bacterium]MCB9386040.1 hypothetical protein [Bryobacterales bacterium]